MSNPNPIPKLVTPARVTRADDLRLLPSLCTALAIRIRTVRGVTVATSDRSTPICNYLEIWADELTSPLPITPTRYDMC
jgi:hypothetical protein